MALLFAHAKPELTARPWFRVLNSHQGQPASLLKLDLPLPI